MDNTCTFTASDLGDFSFGYNENNIRCLIMKMQLAQYINDVYLQGIREFYTICEQGAELWAAQIILLIMKSDPTVKLHCIIPFEEQAAKWCESTRELYYTVLEYATDVTFLNTRYKEGCIDEARRSALDHTELVFAIVVNGEKNEMVKYSNFCGKRVFIYGEFF